jgi:predicted DNA-binding antitoxin AbrB/MazE fold protein
MSHDQEFDAVFHNGHLVPLEPVQLQEDERVRVSVRGEAGASVPVVSNLTLYDVLSSAGLLGCVDGEPADLSTNPAHMEGFGDHQRHSG